MDHFFDDSVGNMGHDQMQFLCLLLRYYLQSGRWLLPPTLEMCHVDAAHFLQEEYCPAVADSNHLTSVIG